MGTAYETGVDVRPRDLDRNGHVNHAVYVSYLEDVRTDYWHDVVGGNDIDRVVANLEVTYERPIGLHDDVRVAIDLGGLRESSVELEYEVRSDGEVAATAGTVQVRVDGEGNPTPLPGYFREAIRGYHRG